MGPSMARATTSLLLTSALLGCPAEPAVPYETIPEARTLAAQAWQRWSPDDLSLDWQQTVLAYGMHRLHAATGEAVHQEFYRTWLEAHRADFDGDSRFISSDSLSPSILAAVLAVEDPAFELAAMTADADRYLFEEAPRTDEGAIVHWGPQHLFGDRPQVWIDSMFMFGVYLLQRWKQTGEPRYLELWAEQFALFAQVCRDPATHLYRHAYDDLDDTNIPAEAVFWARGNSWVLVSAAEAFRLAGDSPLLVGAKEGLRTHAQAFADSQADDGLWRTVLLPMDDDPRNYTETSATALIGYGLTVAVDAGVLDGPTFEPVIAAAVDGVLSRIEAQDDGHHTVTGTSFATNPADYEYYLDVPQLDDQLTGVGAALLLLAEVDGRARP
jgi:unsaturated rhamnogalacturonyl hydrolase